MRVDFEGRSGLSARIPPEHTRLRTIVQGAFGPRRFKAIEPQIRDIINRAIDAFADKGEADLIRDFAYDVPALVIFCLLGVPPEEAPHVKAWSESRALLTWGNLSPEQQIPHAHNMVRYWEYCCALVARRHKEASDDLPGDLVRMQKDGAEISDQEIANICYSQIFAGQETTTSLIGNGLRELLLHPEEWNAVVADRSLMPNAIDEILQIHSVNRRVAAPGEGASERRPASICRKRQTCCCFSARAIATMRFSKTRSGSMSGERTPARICRSATASIIAWARNWRSCRWRSCSRPCPSACPICGSSPTKPLHSCPTRRFARRARFSRNGIAELRTKRPRNH